MPAPQYVSFFVCKKCGYTESIYSAKLKRIICPRCGSPLSIEKRDREWHPRGYGLIRYVSMLAIKPRRSLGEGSTPAVSEENSSFKIVYKLEYLNPTGSFKDRGALTALSYVAESLSTRHILEDSSGNAGISVATYARLYRYKATIIVPKHAPIGKKKFIKMLGAEVVEAPTRDDATKIALDILNRKNCFYVDHLSNPLFIEGIKTIAYELYEQIGVPDAILVPFGSGGLLLGIYYGFKELLDLKIIDKIPHLVAVQSTANPPLYERIYGSIHSYENSTLADGLLVKNPPRIEEAVDALQATNGFVVLVNSSEIIHALKELLDKGFIVEPTSATVYAAFSKIHDKLRDKGCKEVVIILTGSGLKMIDYIASIVTIGIS